MREQIETTRSYLILLDLIKKEYTPVYSHAR